MLVFLFGLSGCGKNHVGNILNNTFNFKFWDADESLTDEMKQCVKNKESFTQEMRDNYFDIVIENIKSLKKCYLNVAVAQGLYKEINREKILKLFPSIVFILIKAGSDLIIKRLRERGDWVDNNYANLISKNFENPNIKHFIIQNNDDDCSVITQLQAILEKNKSGLDSLVFFQNKKKDNETKSQNQALEKVNEHKKLHKNQ